MKPVLNVVIFTTQPICILFFARLRPKKKLSRINPLKNLRLSLSLHFLSLKQCVKERVRIETEIIVYI